MVKTKKTKLILSLSAGLPAIILLYYYLQPLVDQFTYGLLRLTPEIHLGVSVNFFFFSSSFAVFSESFVFEVVSFVMSVVVKSSGFPDVSVIIPVSP